MPETSESVALSPAEAALFAEFRAAIHDIEQRGQGALLVILRQRGLEGDWSLSGNALVRAK